MMEHSNTKLLNCEANFNTLHKRNYSESKSVAMYIFLFGEVKQNFLHVHNLNGYFVQKKLF